MSGRGRQEYSRGMLTVVLGDGIGGGGIGHGEG